MANQSTSKKRVDRYQLERQRKAVLRRLNRMIDVLEGRPVTWKTYSPFPYGVLEKSIEMLLRSLEKYASRLTLSIEKRFVKKRDR